MTSFSCPIHSFSYYQDWKQQLGTFLRPEPELPLSPYKQIYCAWTGTKNASPKPTGLHLWSRPAGHTWMTFPYWMTVPSSLRFSDSFCFFSRSAACCRERVGQASVIGMIVLKHLLAHTWSLLRSTASVVVLPPGLAAFQNCFCAEYLFIGHSLKRQSEEIRGGERQRAPPTPSIILTTVLYKLAHKQRWSEKKKTKQIKLLHSSKDHFIEIS